MSITAGVLNDHEDAARIYRKAEGWNETVRRHIKEGYNMRLIKNFLHNINDIVLAVVIVALAVGIIYWRMQIILDYPKQLADEQAVYTEETAEEDTAEEVTDADAEAAEEAEAGTDAGEAATEADAETDTEAETDAEADADAETDEQPQG